MTASVPSATLESMCRFRTILTLLLCLTIPIQGMAGVFAAAATCPMAQTASHMSMADMDSGQAHDCCTGAHSPGSKTCDTGQDCSYCGHIALTVQQRAEPVVALLAEDFSAPQAFLLTFPPFGVWRPPCSDSLKT